MLSIFFAAALTLNSFSSLHKEEIFSDKPNSDLYWEAFLLSGKNKKEEAKEIAETIRSGDHRIRVYPEWKMPHPENIDAFFDKLFLASVSNNPQNLSGLGLFESIGIREHNRYLNDVSIESLRREARTVEANLELLQEYSFEELSYDQKVSHKIFSWQLAFHDMPEKFIYHEYPVTQMFGIVQHLTAVFTFLHKLEFPEDTTNYLARLGEIPSQLTQAVERIESQRQKGIIAPRFCVEKSIAIIEKFIEPSAEKNVFYTRLATHVGDVPEAIEIIKEKVYPAYRMLQSYLTDLLKEARENNGVGALPDGEAYYAYLLKKYTTTDMSANEVHALGLQEVARIQKQINDIFEEEGMAQEGKTVGELLLELSKQDEHYYANTDEGKKICLDEFLVILDDCRQKLWPLFDLKPSSPVEVKRVPKHEEIGAPLAYYWPGSPDGSRPGAFYVNLYSTRDLPQYQMKTLAVHEAEPGHHFQISLQNQMDIPLLRKLGEAYTAYIEGWALYVEKLADEQGFYGTPLDRIGHLQFELLRAARLVVDTGIHVKKWSREKAIDYLMREGGQEYDGAENEVERYFVMPGQATAYKIGQLKILELRKKAKDALGSRFDIREFHNEVLKLGAVPLSILEEVIGDYIESKLRS